MPLLEVIQIRRLSASIRLTDTTASQVDRYAAFIHASADEVVGQSLAYFFSKDRDFQEFPKSAEAQKITSTLRVRRARVRNGLVPAAGSALYVKLHKPGGNNHGLDRIILTFVLKSSRQTGRDT